MKLKLTDIQIDGGTQPREDIDEDVVAEYAEAMQEGDEFPPVVVFNDGAKKWLADGFHRYHASNYLGFLEIEADVKSGTRRDAILYSVGANSNHGLRRSNRDKRKSVLTLLNDTEWSKNSARWIADKCGVSHTFVNNLKDQVETVSTSNDSNKVVGQDGKEYPSRKRDIFGKKVEEDTGYDIDDGQTIVSDLPDNVDPETGEVLEKSSNRNKKIPEEDKESCPYCGQTLPHHLQIPTDRRR